MVSRNHLLVTTYHNPISFPGKHTEFDNAPGLDDDRHASVFTMAPAFDDIPNELSERIIQLLNLRDIFGLRFSSRLLALKATQGHFKSFFRKKHVHLDESSLTRFVHAAQSGGLFCLLEDLVVVGLTTDPKFLEDELEYPATSDGATDATMKQSLDALRSLQASLQVFRDSKTDLQLLSDALRNLSRSIAPRCLQSLSLQVRIYYHDGRCHETPAIY
jgi:hypothetical protein